MDTPPPTAAPAPTIPPSTMTSVVTMLATKGLSVLAGIAVTHGLMTSSNTETFISGGLLLVSLLWSFWNEYGRAIVMAQLEVLKAKSLAQAAALNQANLPKVTVSQIAAQSPTMGPAEVVKAIATLPPEIKETVASGAAWGASAAGLGVPKAVIALAIGLAALGLGWPGVGHAQTRTPAARPALTGDPVKDIENASAAKKQQAVANGNQSVEDLVASIQKLALPDFQYALAMSKATNNVVSTPCWQAWVDLIAAQQSTLMGPGAPVLDASGKPTVDASGKPTLGPPQPLVEPDPHLVTSIEQISELLANLRPDSTLSTGCAALAAAAGKDAATLISGILGGSGLGLFKLPVPIGPIP
jgi:hypothetical protein